MILIINGVIVTNKNIVFEWIFLFVETLDNKKLVSVKQVQAPT